MSDPAAGVMTRCRFSGTYSSSSSSSSAATGDGVEMASGRFTGAATAGAGATTAAGASGAGRNDGRSCFCTTSRMSHGGASAPSRAVSYPNIRFRDAMRETMTFREAPVREEDDFFPFFTRSLDLKPARTPHAAGRFANRTNAHSAAAASEEALGDPAPAPAPAPAAGSTVSRRITTAHGFLSAHSATNARTSASFHVAGMRWRRSQSLGFVRTSKPGVYSSLTPRVTLICASVASPVMREGRNVMSHTPPPRRLASGAHVRDSVEEMTSDGVSPPGNSVASGFRVRNTSARRLAASGDTEAAAVGGQVGLDVVVAGVDSIQTRRRSLELAPPWSLKKTPAQAHSRRTHGYIARSPRLESTCARDATRQHPQSGRNAENRRVASAASLRLNEGPKSSSAGGAAPVPAEGQARVDAAAAARGADASA
mmetsp:Transcript_11787/g.16019  ORF Transcript_11787/g.16019 Transcript_11787/m.16019 type:complete len:426 (+) Transcript_11787:407-1684(+)